MSPLPSRRLVAALGALVGLTAVAGGVSLAAFPGSHAPPLSLLEHTPFPSFVVPGVILASVVGGTALACALLAWRRAASAVDATLLAGGALTVWIAAQVAMIRAFSWLHGLYGALGLALLALGVRAAMASGSPRLRWVVGVTAAEAVGFLAPGLAGILSTHAGAGGSTVAALVVAGGAMEGLALGAGQAWVMPVRVHRLRYALLTAAAATCIWAAVLATMRLGEALPPWAAGLMGVAVGLAALVGFGALQWLELRRHGARAGSWIGWTALAWLLALPLSFTPGPFVDEATPAGVHLALWACGGLLMAYVMALVTWQGAKRLPGQAAPVVRVAA